MKSIALTAVAAVAFSFVGSVSTASRADAQSYYDFFNGGSSYGGRIPKQQVRIRAPYRRGTIIVSFSDRRLYKITGKGSAMSYPIATPRAISRWSGTLRVSRKQVNPTWTPTARMRRENPKLPAFMPGGHPRNPLGTRALYLGSTLYRIHGTDAPWTIGKDVSKGCIRMYNSHAEEVYAATSVGTRVVVTWKRYAPSTVRSFAAYEPRQRSRRSRRGQRTASYNQDATAQFFSEVFGF